jgi:gas vesicle protein
MFGVPLEGAVIGGAVGAGAGALTTPSLGRPIWR